MKKITEAPKVSWTKEVQELLVWNVLLTWHTLGEFLFHPLRVYSREGWAQFACLLGFPLGWAWEEQEKVFYRKSRQALRMRKTDQQGYQRELSLDKKRTQTGKGQEKSINKIKFSELSG